MSCTHKKTSVPHKLNVRVEGSQEIIGVATVQVCLDCAHMQGTVSTDSLFHPKTVKFSSPPEGWEKNAREALLGLRSV